MPARPSSVDLAPVSDPRHENERIGVLDPRDHAIVADAVSPEFAKPVTLQRLTDRTGVIQRGDAIAKEAKNSLGGLRTDCFATLAMTVVEFARGGAFELNPPGHGAG